MLSVYFKMYKAWNPNVELTSLLQSNVKHTGNIQF